MLKISIAKGALLASGLAGLVLATPAQAQLEQALQTAKRSTAQSAASQQRVAGHVPDDVAYGRCN